MCLWSCQQCFTLPLPTMAFVCHTEAAEADRKQLTTSSNEGY